MSRQTNKGRIVARFSDAELAPSTGSPVENFSLEIARSTAAKVAAFDGIYLQHDAHRRAFGSFDYLRELNRAPGPKRAMRLIGPSSAGKSTAIEQYERIVSRRGGYEDGCLPVISIKLDRACTTKRLVTSVLDRYGDEYSNSSNESTLRARAYMCIRRFGTELIFVDEVQHLAFRSSERSDPTDALKRMLDDGVVSLVFAGDPSALPLMMRNIQLANRMITPCDMEPLDFRKAEDRSVFRSFVRRLDAAMVENGVTARTSGLDEQRTLHCLSVVSSGLLGRVVNLVRIAVEISSRRGADLVEIHDLSRATMNWAIPQLITRYDPFSSGVVDE